MPPKNQVWTDPVSIYSYSVIDGSEPAGPLVIGACERHLAEMALQDSDAFPFYFDPDPLDRFRAFCGLLRQYKGTWKGKPLELMLWQEFIAGSILCWKRTDNDLRRFQTAYIEIPRKNGKSALAAALGLWFLTSDGESAAEVYCMATKRDQAKLVWQDAWKFYPEPSRTKHLRQVAAVIEHRASGSKMIPLGRDSKTLDGLNPSVGIADEIHEWPSPALWDVVEDGMGARSQPLMFGITTAGNNKLGPAMTLRRTAEDLAMDKGRRGFVLDSFFGYVACPDKKDFSNWRDPRVWRIANPGLGVMKGLDWMEQQALQSSVVASKLNTFKNKQLNVWTDTHENWIDSELWASMAANPSALLAACEGQVCYGGLDLAKVTDLTALTLLFPPTDNDGLRSLWRKLSWHWCPKDRAIARSEVARVPYLQWAKEGRLTLTEGNATDFVRVRTDIIELAAKFEIASMAYDRFLSGETVQQLVEEGIPMIEHGQGFQSMAPPTQEVERLALGRQIAHDGCPLFAWQMANVSIRRDPAGNPKPDKERSREKIDGPVSMIMAVGAAMQFRPVDFVGPVGFSLG